MVTMMKWNEILLPDRERGRNQNRTTRDLRTEFEKDYHRIIGSPSFRRLQDKTQVFPLDKSDFIRTRLTHSLEVSSFARSLGANVGERLVRSERDPAFTVREKADVSCVLQCAGLLHDIGNPPFGHFGEVCIRQWFRDHLDEMEFRGKPLSTWLTEQMKQDFFHFEGNAQALRLLTRLHFLVDDAGMNLTYALLASMIKYPCSSLECDSKGEKSSRKKFGYFYADRKIFSDIMEKTGLNGSRSPLAFLLEAADDIAYKTGDIEDAFQKGFITYRDLHEELKLHAKDKQNAGLDAVGILERQFKRGHEEDSANAERYAVLNWAVRMQGELLDMASDAFLLHYDEIMNGTYERDLFYGTAAEGWMELLGDMGFRYVFDSDFIYKLELPTSEIYDYLLTKYCHAVLYYDTDEWEYKRSPVDFKLVSILPDNYLRAYHKQAAGKSEGERLYHRLLLVTDNICGMTDSYARNFYQDIRGISLV